MVLCTYTPFNGWDLYTLVQVSVTGWLLCELVPVNG